MTGISNVIHGVGHWVEHLIHGDSVLNKYLGNPLDELVAYEKKHGSEQLKAIAEAGLKAFESAHAAGQKVGPSILAGVAVAFETGLAEVKTLSTQAMTLLISGAAK